MKNKDFQYFSEMEQEMELTWEQQKNPAMNGLI